MNIPWEELSKKAWQVRENGFIMPGGKTKVGAAVYTSKGNIYMGCNIQHIYRSHDIHAEVNAISNMIANGENKFIAILIAAKRYKFTPCGSCMDWIMQHGGKDSIVAYQNDTQNDIHKYTAHELMPHYPE